MFLDYQIIILEGFLKDRVTLKTSNDAENSALITGINYTFTYIHIEDIFSENLFLVGFFSHVLAGFSCQII